MNFGIIYYGEYVTQNFSKALHYFTLAANQNNSNAQFALGVIYLDSKFISVDFNKATLYLTM